MIFEWDIPIRNLFAHRIIIGSVDRKCKYSGFILHQTGSAISLMYIQIQNQDSTGKVFLQKKICCDRYIIEYAKAAASVPKSMMRTTGYIHCDSIFLCKCHTFVCAAHDDSFPVH